ncbi:MAG: hypothetical protein ABI882_17605 [Acidobacteriota bacterium]
MVPTGVNLAWTSAQNPIPTERLIVVTLRGDCQAGATELAGKFKDKTPLASTAVTDGKVLPFSWVDCDALNKFLKQKLLSQDAANRPEIFGRAIARLIAHEFYHVLTETEAHTLNGISKAAFSTADLLTTYFAFEPEAIANLRLEQPTLAILERAEESLGYEYIPAPEPVEALAAR